MYVRWCRALLRFLSRLVSKHITDTLSFYDVFVSFWLLRAAIAEKKALIQNSLLRKTLNNIYWNSTHSGRRLRHKAL